MSCRKPSSNEHLEAAAEIAPAVGLTDDDLAERLRRAHRNLDKIMSNPNTIELRAVRKTFRFFTLDDLTLDLEPGQIMGFVGPNGAGKSTTIRLALGLLTPDAGEVRVLGHRMPDAQAVAKRDIGYVVRRDATSSPGARSAGT